MQCERKRIVSLSKVAYAELLLQKCHPFCCVYTQVSKYFSNSSKWMEVRRRSGPGLFPTVIIAKQQPCESAWSTFLQHFSNFCDDKWRIIWVYVGKYIPPPVDTNLRNTSFNCLTLQFSRVLLWLLKWCFEQLIGSFYPCS